MGDGGETESSLNEMGQNQDLEAVQNLTGEKGVKNGRDSPGRGNDVAESMERVSTSQHRSGV